MKRPVSKPNLSAAGTVVFKGMDDVRGLGLDAFKAVDPGWCDRCQRWIVKDEWIFRDGKGRTVGVDCCATDGDRPAPVADYNPDEEVGLAQVMPLRRSRADMCPNCFQIPASNGTCGC